MERDGDREESALVVELGVLVFGFVVLSTEARRRRDFSAGLTALFLVQ